MALESGYVRSPTWRREAHDQAMLNLSPSVWLCAGQAFGQPAGHRGVVQVDQADPGHDGQPLLLEPPFAAFFFVTAGVV